MFYSTRASSPHPGSSAPAAKSLCQVSPLTTALSLLPQAYLAMFRKQTTPTTIFEDLSTAHAYKSQGLGQGRRHTAALSSKGRPAAKLASDTCHHHQPLILGTQCPGQLLCHHLLYFLPFLDEDKFSSQAVNRVVSTMVNSPISLCEIILSDPVLFLTPFSGLIS